MVLRPCCSEGPQRRKSPWKAGWGAFGRRTAWASGQAGSGQRGTDLGSERTRDLPGRRSSFAS